MITHEQHGREWIDSRASIIEALAASEALPLDDPGQATLTARMQAFALLGVADALGDVYTGLSEIGAGVGDAIEKLASG
jgi:hypothetical protein